MLRVKLLGCGASSGVPVIGCSCSVCTSNNPRNKRTRVSIVLETEDKRILVDTSPDMRSQCLTHNINVIDAVLYTHAHADHLHGIDDLRLFNYTLGAVLDTYGDAQTIELIQKRFSYVFMEPKFNEQGWFRPSLNPITIKTGMPFWIGKTEILPFAQQHGQGTTIGLKIGNFAYSTDTNGLSREVIDMLKGIDTWIVDCLRHKPAPTHAHLEMALDWIAQVKPKRAFLTHLNHEFDYDELAAKLPKNVSPAYDGLTLEIA